MLSPDRITDLINRVETEYVGKNTLWSIDLIVSQEEAKQIQTEMGYPVEGYGFYHFSQTKGSAEIPSRTQWESLLCE